ncbi:tbc domain-containing protein [Stylonychia lemnae]|uniref:Tbc domain-containing protein n=1 Tax=Stylonychia lemnae TaxID=5949 RepID=A0A078AA46_STYLE|nr:tbc domain-containing protein [Stylonychia lemnae]|eukprot:CDW78427.1 tbc domain-containing protein [Stylonychia lemnae]
MESSNSSASNLSLKNKVNMSPQQQAQVIYNGSHKNLQKSNSSPMNSFINNNKKRNMMTNSQANLALNHQILLNNINHIPTNISNVAYNSTQPYRDLNYDAENHGVANITNHDIQNNSNNIKFVYKSNSQKSINWEGTPQNQTHKSINNKNTGSQSHQSLFGSQGKGVQNSSKKMLMPSGSSGTLLRKEIIEMDEVNSSSSSSIGREDNANQAFNASSKLKESKPFAPDNIFVNNAGKNLGDQDSGGDLENINQTAQQSQPSSSNNNANHSISQQQMKNAKGQRQGNIGKDQKVVQHQVPPQLNSQSSGGRISVGTPRVQSNSSSANETLTKKIAAKAKIISNTSAKYSPSNDMNAISHSNASHNQTNISELNNITSLSNVYKQDTQDNINGKPPSLSQTQKVRISFVEQSSHMNLFNNLSGMKQDDSSLLLGQNSGIGGGISSVNQKISSNPTQKQNVQISNHPVQKINKNMIQKQNTFKINSNSSRPNNSNNSNNNYGQSLDQQSMIKDSVKSSLAQQSNEKTSHSQNQMFNAGFIQASQYSSKSPAEKMIESSLLQQAVNVTQSSTLAGKHQKLMTQELYGISNQILTPNRHSININGKKQSATSKASNTKVTALQKQQQTLNLPETKKAGKSNKASAKNSSQDLSNVSHDEVQSPSMINSLKKHSGNIKMKGDSNNFNEISESIIEENIEKFPEDEEDSIKIHNYNQLQRNQITVQKSNHFDQSRISPNKSNKIPSSIAFKRSSNDQSLSDSNQIISGRGEPTIQITRSKGVKKEKIKISKGDKKTFNNFIDSEDDVLTHRTNQPQSTIFLMALDKLELQKRIHYQNNKDFSSVYDSRMKLLLKGVDLFIYIMGLMRKYLNFDDLLQIMTISREFRQEFNKTPTLRQKKIYKLYKNQLRFIIINGFPNTLQRIKYWNFKTKFSVSKKKKPNQFESLKKQKLDESEAIDILKDVSRTFPDMAYFQKPQKGQQELFYILNAVAKKKTHTGYIQGMNFLAGMILINLQNGEDTFYMMMSILNTHEFDKILDLESGGRFQVLCYQLEIFLQEYMPHLANHFRKLKIPTDIYAANWFITMFCCELSMDLVFSILDIFLLEGIKSLLRISLALLSYLHDRLLSMNDEECMNFLSSRNKDIQMDSQTLLENAYNFKITDSLLQDLELFYKLKNKKKHPIQQIFKAFNRLSLQEEEVKQKNQPPKTRSYWIVQAATPQDLRELLKTSKNITPEEIDYFYQKNIKNRKLREIVEELQTEEDSKIANVNNYAFEKKDIQNAKMLQPSHRKKETQHSKYTQSAMNQNKKKQSGQMLHFSNDSNNTIKEMTNDFSKGGQSGSKKNQNNSSYAASNFSNGDTNKLISTSDQRNLHLSVVMGGSDEGLITPRRLQKINNDLSTKNKKSTQPNQLSMIKKESESPFIQQIGTKIKSYLFGNFFKTQEKLNKSYEESEQMKNYIPFSRQDQRKMNMQPSFENDVSKKQNRSKSIHQSVLNPNTHRESPEIRVTTQTYQSNQNYQKSPYISLGQSNNYHSLANHLPSKEHKIHVTTEENHNIPNNQSSIFNTTTHLQQVSRIDAIHINNEYFINDHGNIHNRFIANMVNKPSPHNQLLQHRINKQISKSLERGTSEVDSAIYGDEDDDCEIELLSQSADCTIQTVEENIHFKRNQEFKGATKRPEILIEKDIIAGDDEILDSQNYSNIDIQYSKANKNLPLFNINGTQLSQTIKVNSSMSSSQALVNFKKQQQIQNYNSNPKRDSNTVKEVFNIKTMRSSPPVSPKDRQKQTQIQVQRGGHTIKTATITINKKVK